MIEQDTIRLLRECDSGVKMGISSFDDVLEYVRNDEFKNLLLDSKRKHESLTHEIQELLDKYHDEGKDPNPLIKGMSWIKTKAEIMMNENDETIASLMTDGCNMGVKSLSKFLNEYEAADEKSKDIAKRLIDIESSLAINIRKFL